MISGALLFDAAIGNVQEKAIKQYKASNNEVVFYSYGFGFCYLLVAMMIFGDLLTGLQFCVSVSISNNFYIKKLFLK